jgi:Domain of unknown function (DUF4150)
MSNQVYANNMEISCKSADGKSICAFPDVCFTPPLTPATPPGVPIPYPNTGMASDCTDGSSSVKISGQEVMLKNKSYFKKSTGDEAGSAPKKGVITSVNMGKVYFNAWSMDVRVEGENVVRNMDITTHNHNPPPGQTPPMVYFDAVAIAVPELCREQADEVNKACKGATKRPQKLTKKGNLTDDGLDCTPECRAKQKCIYVPKGKDKQACCSPDTTGDHQIEDHWIWEVKNEKLMPDMAHLEKKPGGPYNGAPTLCTNASRFTGIHGVGHGTRGVLEDAEILKPGKFSYKRGKEISMEGQADQCAEAKNETGVDPSCAKGCAEAQLDAFYGAEPNKELHKPERKQALTAQQKMEEKLRQLKKQKNLDQVIL